MNKTAKKLIIKGILSESDARWAINEALEKAIDEVFDVAYQLGFEDGEKAEDEDMIVFDTFNPYGHNSRDCYTTFEDICEGKRTPTDGPTPKPAHFRPPWQEDEF